MDEVRITDSAVEWTATSLDEAAVIEFLKPRLAHLLKLWEPLV